MNTFPISVCVPSCNYAGYLPQTLDSILCQSFADFELLIIDDGSTDGAPDVIGEYAARDSRIRFLVNAQGKGMVHNWNECLSEARGKYIKFVFADDLLVSQDALQQMMSALASDDHLSLVSCARKVIDAQSRVIGLRAPFRRDLTAEGTALISLCLARQDNLIGEPTAVMFRKADAVRGFQPGYRQIVDQEMWFHLLEKGRFAYIREPLASFRSHPGQQTVRNRDHPLAMLDDVFRLNEEYLNKPYVRVGRLGRTYIRWDGLYRLWRLHATGQIEKQTAVGAIERRYGYRKFVCFYPVYKAGKPWLKLARAMRPPEKSL
jgi:glycosyltransferase involved in cell wall biosynthesis